MIDREELERMHEAATKGDWYVSPFEVNAGGAARMLMGGDAFSVAYFGERSLAENAADVELTAYLRNAVPDILKLMDERNTLAAENAAITAKVERLMNSLEPFAQLSRRKANFVIRPDDPILLEAVRALEN